MHVSRESLEVECYVKRDVGGLFVQPECSVIEFVQTFLDLSTDASNRCNVNAIRYPRCTGSDHSDSGMSASTGRHRNQRLHDHDFVTDREVMSPR